MANAIRGGTLRAMAGLCALSLLAGCVSGDVLGSASREGPEVAATASVLPEPSPRTTALEETPTGDESLVAGLGGEVTASASSSAQFDDESTPAAPPPDQGVQLAALPDAGAQAARSGGISALDETVAPPPVAERQKKTYLINGLLSAVPFIGYGFRNLHEKMPEAQLFSYMGVVEGPAVIAPKIVREVEAAYRADPDIAVNLIGISLGADLITVIANKLDEKNIPVNYLGIVDGTSLKPIPDNVRKADNLTCSNLDCTRAKARLAPGNSVTVLETKIYRSSHIPLGNHDGLHARVIAQSNS